MILTFSGNHGGCEKYVYDDAISITCIGEEEALSPESLARISDLEQGLASNPYNYANHEELVKLLKSGEDFDRS